MMLYVLHVHAAQGNLHNFGVFHTKSTSTNFEAKANNATNRKENGNKNMQLKKAAIPVFTT